MNIIIKKRSNFLMGEKKAMNALLCYVMLYQ